MGIFDFIFGGEPDIAKMQKNKDIDGLIKALAHTQTSLRERAAKALGILQNDRAVNPLIAVLDDQCKDVQMSAANALNSFARSKIGSASSKVDNLLREAQQAEEKKRLREEDRKREAQEAMARQAMESNTTAAKPSDNTGTTVAEVLLCVWLETDGKLSNSARIDLLDELRAICNSSFSRAAIQKGLNHSHPGVREGCEKFLREIGKMS
jgi:hypothetical protein